MSNDSEIRFITEYLSHEFQTNTIVRARLQFLMRHRSAPLAILCKCIRDLAAQNEQQREAAITGCIESGMRERLAAMAALAKRFLEESGLTADRVEIVEYQMRDGRRSWSFREKQAPPPSAPNHAQANTPEEYAASQRKLVRDTIAHLAETMKMPPARRECQGPMCSNEAPVCFGILFEVLPGQWKYEPHEGAREAHCVYECCAFAAEHNVIVRMKFGDYIHEFDCSESASKRRVKLIEAAKLINEQTNPLPPGADIVLASLDGLKRIATEADTDIAAGDPVRLKSGGPVMYVEEVQAGMARCRWTKATGLVERGEFPVECLEPADDGN